MRFLDVLGTRKTAAALEAATVTAGAFTPAPVVDPSTLPIGSPWSTGDLARIVADDIFGPGVTINTRAAAMRLPAIAKGRNRVCTAASRLPLREVDAAGAVMAPGPRWMSRTDGATTPQHRLAWTVDDLIFYGWSCWVRVNDPATGLPETMTRVNMGAWRVNDDNHVEIDGIEKPDDEVLLIPGLHEGILTFGLDVLTDARDLYRTVRSRIQNPTPQLELHQTGGAPLTDAEIDGLIARWAAARKGDNGGVAFTTPDLETKELGAGGDAQLLIEARNASAVDQARILGVSASTVDATADKASLTYETTTGRNREFFDVDLALYLVPIEARLSMDDVMPIGHRAAFDLGDFTTLTPAPTGPTLED